MITILIILIITNLIFAGLWLLTLRNTSRKTLLLETDYQWKKSGDLYYYKEEGLMNGYHLKDAAKKQQLTEDCRRLRVPQRENKYIAEGWKDEKSE
jgi:hypothetical protein